MVVKCGLFFPGVKRRMGRVRGCSGSLRGFDYPKTWRVLSPWQLFFAAERWVRKGWRLAWEWTQTELKHAWHMRESRWRPKPRYDEMSDKTVEIKSPMCAFTVLGSVGFTQPPQEGQETIINCSLQLNWQNNRQNDVQESQRRRRLIWQPLWHRADMGRLSFEGKLVFSHNQDVY